MQTIGEKLEEARKRRGISLREASEVTKIRSEYLGNFENNTFDLKLPEVYIRGFLRSYAQFLKLNGDKIITDYNAHQLGESEFSRPDNREFLGRMDITTKADLEQADSPEAPDPTSRRQAPPPASATESGLEYNNFDKSSLLKGGVAIGGAGIVVVLIVFLVLAVFRTSPEDTTLAEGTENETTSQQQEITLIATGNDITNVSVTEISTGVELFRGPLAEGERQRVPFDEQVRLSYTHAQHLRLEHDGQEYQMGGQNVGRSTFPPNQ